MSYFADVTITDEYGQGVELTAMNEMRIVEPIRLVGSTFEGTTIDANFWTTSVANSATASQSNNKMTLASGTNSAGSSTVQSVATSRYTGGSQHRYRGQIRLGDTGTANNIRRWGCFDANNGAFFQLNGSVLSVVTRKSTVDTVVASGSWNTGTTYVPTLTNATTYEIYYTSKSVFFVINDHKVHTVSSTTDTWSDSNNFPIRGENTNSGNTTDVSIEFWAHTMYRLGKIHTESRYKYVHGAATTLCKRSAGRINNVVINANSGTTITLYDDGAGGTTNAFAIIQPNQIGTLTYDCSFF